MTTTRFLLCAASIATFALFTPVQAGSFSDAQKTELEEMMRGYLLDHPELLREMSEKLEARDKQTEEDLRNKALVAFKSDIFQNKADPFIGPETGDVTVVEFMDYNCGWCKKAMGEMTTLMDSDKKVKVVFKEFPIFGEHSEYAARAALAAAKQGKYWELHRALFSHEGQVTKDVVDQLAEANGLDLAKMKEDITSREIGEHIAANMELGKNLAINGTPAFIVDAKVYGGYMPLDGLNAAIAEVRANGCKMC
jgi:protein-disulfide isomerase